MQMYSIMSTKGGSGKTKCNLSLAAALAVRHPGKRTLLVDACPDQGTLSWLLAKQEDDTGQGLGRLLERWLRTGSVVRKEVPLVRVWVQPSLGITLDFMPAASETLGDLHEQGNNTERITEAMEAVLSSYSDAYDYCVIDTIPWARMQINLAIKRLVDSVAIVVDARNDENIAGLPRMLKLFKRLGAPLAGIVGNMLEVKYATSRHTRYAIELMAELAGHRILEWVPYNGSMMATSTVYDWTDGRPAVGVYAGMEINPGQRKNLQAIADKFINIAEAMEESNART